MPPAEEGVTFEGNRDEYAPGGVLVVERAPKVIEI